MIPRAVYTLLGIILWPLHEYRTHAMIREWVYTPLGIITCPVH